MKKTQPDPANEQPTVDLPQTEPEIADGGKTELERALAYSQETGELPPEPATARSGELGLGLASSVGKTYSLDERGVDEATELPRAGAATLDAPPSGERGNTLSFSLHSDAEDTERTLPPGAEQP
jgi:hypothetical protein